MINSAWFWFILKLYQIDIVTLFLKFLMFLFIKNTKHIQSIFCVVFGFPVCSYVVH